MTSPTGPASPALTELMSAAEALLFDGDRADALWRLHAAIVEPGLAEMEAELRTRYGFFPPDDWQVIDRVYVRARELLTGNGFWAYGAQKVRDQLGLIEPGLRRTALEGAATLEFGAGVFAPHLISSVLYVLGAARCFSMEPDGVVDPASASRALAELLGAMLTRPRDWQALGLDQSAAVSRLSRFDLGALVEGDLDAGLSCVDVRHEMATLGEMSARGPFDFVYSIAVLEHVRVAEMDETLAQMRRVMKQGGVMCHAIDFTDHNFHAGLCPHRWGYLVGEGDGYGVNLLPLSHMVEATERAGFDILEVVRHTTPPPQDVLDRILPEYRRRPIEDLETHLGVIVSRSR